MIDHLNQGFHNNSKRSKTCLGFGEENRLGIDDKLRILEAGRNCEAAFVAGKGLEGREWFCIE